MTKDGQVDGRGVYGEHMGGCIVGGLKKFEKQIKVHQIEGHWWLGRRSLYREAKGQRFLLVFFLRITNE